eukprot:GHVP01040550.1.p1 GENE.GHVP01040550.1~~GHVP01040550.1.p1  ORF type:complete len:434 (+),score=42.10 GHVP01040550.1:169-1470(+)
MFSWYIKVLLHTMAIKSILGSHSSSSEMSERSDCKEVKKCEKKTHNQDSDTDSSCDNASVSSCFTDELSVHDIPSSRPKEFVRKDYILDKIIRNEYQRLCSRLSSDKNSSTIIREYSKSILIIGGTLSINIKTSKKFGECCKKNEVTIYNGGKSVYLFGNGNTVNLAENCIKLIIDGNENKVSDHGESNHIVIGTKSHNSTLNLCNKDSEAVVMGDCCYANISGSTNLLTIEGQKCLIDLTGEAHNIVLSNSYNTVISKYTDNVNIEVSETGTKNTIKIGEGVAGIVGAFIYLEGSGNSVITHSRIHGLINGRNNNLKMLADRSKIVVTGSMNTITAEKKSKAYLEQTATNNVLNFNSGLNALRISGRENAVRMKGEGNMVSVREKATNNTLNIYERGNNIRVVGKHNYILLSSKQNEVQGNIKENNVKYLCK